MTYWDVQRIWEGSTAYIIGGGPSLSSFPWKYLKPRHTIGCNSAFLLGSEICDICLFGDAEWFEAVNPQSGRLFCDELAEYKGRVVTCHPNLQHTDIPWLYTIPRQPRGLHTEALGWNGNTGAAAINLALIMGAATVCLLGFDLCKADDGRTHWHDRKIEEPKQGVYQKWLENYHWIERDLPLRFPKSRIVNIEGYSNVPNFPTIPLGETS